MPPPRPRPRSNPLCRPHRLLIRRRRHSCPFRSHGGGMMPRLDDPHRRVRVIVGVITAFGGDRDREAHTAQSGVA